jgi:cellobiose-specific phosphotransferase system component IIA
MPALPSVESTIVNVADPLANLHYISAPSYMARVSAYEAEVGFYEVKKSYEEAINAAESTMDEASKERSRATRAIEALAHSKEVGNEFLRLHLEELNMEALVYQELIRESIASTEALRSLMF